jgi:hypothetical protein
VEANAEEMKSVAEQEKAPKEDAAVETDRALRSGIGAGIWLREVEEMDPGKLWFLDEVDNLLQKK